MNVKPDFSKSANMASTAPAFLSVWDMHSYYGESYIVQGINFNVHEGEILALLGRNGTGNFHLAEVELLAPVEGSEADETQVFFDQAKEAWYGLFRKWPVTNVFTGESLLVHGRLHIARVNPVHRKFGVFLVENGR